MKAFRIVVGIFVSAAFAWATLSRVDLPEVGQALSRAAPFGVALALGCAWLEIAVRSWRWRFLLSPLGKVGYGQAFAYTCVGYFANTFLPMRLGDVARAYLAATALRLPDDRVPKKTSRDMRSQVLRPIRVPEVRANPRQAGTMAERRNPR